jgi:hypothetical protein
MSKRLAFASAAAAFLAVLTIGVWAFGGGGSDRADEATLGFCALDTDFRIDALSDPVGFDRHMGTSAGQQRLRDALDRSPGAIAEDVRVVIEAIREHGHAAFADPSVFAAADRIEAWENRYCRVLRTTTTFPFPVGNIPGTAFECPPGFVQVDELSPMYRDLLDVARISGEWVDTSELESYLLEHIPQIEGFEGMGGVICLPADPSGDFDPDEIVEHMEQYFPPGFDFGR